MRVSAVPATRYRVQAASPGLAMLAEVDRDKAVWTAWGRQVRPGSLWLSVVTTGLGVNAILEKSALSGPFETVVGIIALVAVGMLWVGWWAQDDLRAMTAGLLTTCFVWATAAATVTAQSWASLPQTVVSAWCWCGLAGTLYLRDRRETP